jgi:CBS domain containing-hemolysin-like protein
MLCLAFLLMIGLSLVAGAFGVDIPKGYLYAAIAFSIVVESFNQLRLANVQRRLARVPLRQRTTDAVLRLLGGRRGATAADGLAEAASAAGGPATFGSAERDMVAGVMLLGDRLTRSIMTPRQDIVWLDIDGSMAGLRQTLIEHGHSRYPVCEGTVERLEGVVLARDILPDLLDGKRPDLRARMHVPLSVRDRLPVLRLIDLLKTTPTRFAVVVADNGTVEGVVTPTDVLAAIAGGLVEDEDAVPPPVRLDDGAIRFDGTTAVDEAAMLLDRPAMRGDGDYATIAGFVLDHLRHIPAKDECFEWEDWRFAVTGMDGHRIVEVVASPIDDG